MTVRELTELLSSVPEDKKDIKVWGNDYRDNYEIETIEMSTFFIYDSGVGNETKCKEVTGWLLL